MKAKLTKADLLVTEIERLARALALADDAPVGSGADLNFMWQHHVPHVRAILQAMREPSEEAAEQGGCEVMNYEPGFPGADIVARKTWQAMIDHILSEAP